MNDLISRQATIDALEKSKGTYVDRHVIIGKMQDIVNNLPSAEPEQHSMRGWICPVCGRGLSPLMMVCPCNNGKEWEVMC